jgi:hypothetical protein
MHALPRLGFFVLSLHMGYSVEGLILTRLSLGILGLGYTFYPFFVSPFARPFIAYLSVVVVE